MKPKVVVLLFLVSSVYVPGVYSGWGLPFDIPGLSDGVTKAIGVGIAPLQAVKAPVAEYLAKDCSGRLELVQNIIGFASEPLNTLLSSLQALSSAKSFNFIQTYDALSGLFADTCAFVGQDKYLKYVADNSSRTNALQLAPRISPAASDAMMKAIWNLINSLLQQGGNDLYEALNTMWINTNNAFTVLLSKDPNKPVTPATISQYVPPSIVDNLTVKIANVVAAVNTLAKALQKTVLEINTSLIDPDITAKLPTVSPRLANFDGSADWTRNYKTDLTNCVVDKLNLTFDPVTSNPSSWNNGNIADLTKFLGDFNSQVETSFSQQFPATAIDELRASVTAFLTDQSTQLAFGLDKVYTVIGNTDSARSSAEANACVARHKATLLTETVPSVLRLGECILLEANTLFVLKIQIKEALQDARHDVTRLMKQLRICKDQNGPCVKELFASIAATEFQQAKMTLKAISDYTETGLKDTAGRIADCTAAIAADIQAEAQAILKGVNGCGAILSNVQRACPAAPALTNNL